MTVSETPAVVVTGRHPIYSALASFPVACFTLTLLSDLAYWQTSNLLWQHFSEWLLFAGLVFGGLAALAGIIISIFRYSRYEIVPAWPYAIGMALVLVLAFVNSLVHAGDGWTAIVPTGLVLSAATVLVLLITGWLGWSADIQRRGATTYG